MSSTSLNKPFKGEHIGPPFYIQLLVWGLLRHSCHIYTLKKLKYTQAWHI